MSRSAEKKIERGDCWVSPSMVCYAEKQAKSFWSSSLGHMVQFDTIIFCRTFKNFFGQFVWIEKKSHYSSRVSLHEAPTKKPLFGTKVPIFGILAQPKTLVPAFHVIFQIFDCFFLGFCLETKSYHTSPFYYLRFWIKFQKLEKITWQHLGFARWPGLVLKYFRFTKGPHFYFLGFCYSVQTFELQGQSSRWVSALYYFFESFTSQKVLSFLMFSTYKNFFALEGSFLRKSFLTLGFFEYTWIRQNVTKSFKDENKFTFDLEDDASSRISWVWFWLRSIFLKHDGVAVKARVS